MSRMGRPSKISDDMQERICALLRGGAYRVDACAIVGVHFSTMARWMEKGKAGKAEKYVKFRAAVMKAEAIAKMGPTAVMSSAAKESPKWASTWLKMRWPQQYSENRMKKEEQNTEPIEIKITGLPRPADKE